MECEDNRSLPLKLMILKLVTISITANYCELFNHHAKWEEVDSKSAVRGLSNDLMIVYQELLHWLLYCTVVHTTGPLFPLPTLFSGIGVHAGRDSYTGDFPYIPLQENIYSTNCRPENSFAHWFQVYFKIFCFEYEIHTRTQETKR